jgi:hypothetical protein
MDPDTVIRGAILRKKSPKTTAEVESPILWPSTSQHFLIGQHFGWRPPSRKFLKPQFDKHRPLHGKTMRFIGGTWQISRVGAQEKSGNRVTRWRPGSSHGEVMAGGKGRGDNLDQLNGPLGILLVKKKTGAGRGAAELDVEKG